MNLMIKKKKKIKINFYLQFFYFLKINMFNF